MSVRATAVALLLGLAATSARADDDPYARFVAGEGEQRPTAIEVDASGATYLAGVTDASVHDGVSPTLQRGPGGRGDVFVTKIGSDGTTEWLVVLGGHWRDEPRALAVDDDGSVVVAGDTESVLFPTEAALQAGFPGVSEGFVTRIAPDGRSLEWSTFYGGSGEDVVRDIALGADGAVTLVGTTRSFDLPLARAFQSASANAPSPYSVGIDGFVARISPDGQDLQLSSYLGGSWVDLATSVALTRDGATRIVGYTSSLDFPVLGAVQPERGGGGSDVSDAFVVGLDIDDEPTFATYVGGRGYDAFVEVFCDEDDRILAVGRADAAGYPVVGGAPHTLGTELVLTQLSADGSQIVSSTYGGPYTPVVRRGDDGALRVARGTRLQQLDLDGSVIDERSVDAAPGGLDVFTISADGSPVVAGTIRDDALFPSFPVRGTHRSGVETWVARLAPAYSEPAAAPSVQSDGDSGLLVSFVPFEASATHYELLRDPHGQAFAGWESPEATVVATFAPGDSAQFHDAHLERDGAYGYHVRARLPDGRALRSAFASGRTRPPTPIDLTASVLADGDVSLSWDTATPWRGNEAFDLEWSSDGGPWWPASHLSFPYVLREPNTTASHSELTPVGALTYRLRTRNSGDVSGWTEAEPIVSRGQVGVETLAGRVRYGPRKRTRLRLRARLLDADGTPASLNPRADGMFLRIGPGTLAGRSLWISAGSRHWTKRRGVWNWRGRVDRYWRGSAHWNVRYNSKTGLLTVKCKRQVLGDEPEPFIRLEFESGDVSGADTRVWTPRNASTLEYRSE